MPNPDYPEICLKGIKAKDCIGDDGNIRAHLLHFEKGRTDTSWKQSINWQDDDQAIEFTLRQRRQDGSLLFKFGVAPLSRIEIDRINSRPFVNGALSYERELLGDDNKYHGNLILEGRTTKLKMEAIAAILVSAQEKVIPQHLTE